MQKAAQTTPSNSQLPMRTKLAFGLGDLGTAMIAGITGFFLNAFLIEVAQVPPATAGIIFLITKIWDSVNDPLIGVLTDRTKTRWGRRRPWLLFGAVPLALAYFLHWVVPDLGDAGKFWYYLIVALLLDTAYTAVNVPYSALTPELSNDYNERTTLNSYRFSFSILGGLVAIVGHQIVTGMFTGQAQATGNSDLVYTGYLVSAGIWAAIIIISNIITFAYTRENQFTEPKEELSFFAGLKIAFRNRPFIYVTLIYLLSWLAIQFVQNNLILYVKYWVNAEEAFIGLVLILQVCAFAFLLIWTRVSHKIGRQRVYYLGTSVWILASVILFFVPPNNLTMLYPIAFLASIGTSVCYLIPWSLLTDVVDVDELETGQRREGIFYGFFVFLQKLGISIGLAISNFILQATGYVAPEYPGAPPFAGQQPEAVLQALRSFVTIAPIVILLIGMLVVRAYPITRQQHAEILYQLRQKKNS